VGFILAEGVELAFGSSAKWLLDRRIQLRLYGWK